jgi:hypothetical protein
MKNRNNKVTAVLFVVTLALAPMVQAEQEALRPPPTSLVRPTPTAAYEGASENSEALEAQNHPAVTIHATDNVRRGKTGSFVLNMKPALMLGGMYVNFSIGGTAVAGVDYVQPLSPAYIGQAGYGTILIQTLPDPRGPSNQQSYSVVVTLQAGLGYALGAPRSATMWIKP